jgi:hypothetical protein
MYIQLSTRSVSFCPFSFNLSPFTLILCLDIPQQPLQQNFFFQAKSGHQVFEGFRADYLPAKNRKIVK